MFIQALIPQTTTKAFHKGVLGRLAGSDIVPIDAGVLAPLQDGMGRHLSAIVRDNHAGFATLGNEPIQFPHHAMIRQRSVGHGG